MSTMNTQPSPCDGVSVVMALESGLAETLARTAQQVQHAECFDQEQRAEIYAILQALKTDTEAHRIVAEFLARRLGGKAHDV
jgi:hypothetical protein